YKNNFYNAAREYKPDYWTLRLDITNKDNIEHISTFAKDAIHLPPFDYWLERFSKVDLDTSSRFHYQELMEQVGLLASIKINEIFCNFTFHAMRETYKFEIIFDRTEIKL